MKNKALYIICALLMVILGLSDALRGIFTPLFTDIFGFSMAQVGIIVSASYLGNLVCLLFGGVILDKIGRKKAMALFVLALAISELILLGGRVYFLLVLGFFLTLGISTLLNTTMNLLSDSFSATKSLMLLNALFFLQGIGTSGSQFILSRFSSSVMVWNGVLIAMAVLLIPLCIAITRIHTEGKAEVKKNEEAVRMIPVAMASALGGILVWLLQRRGHLYEKLAYSITIGGALSNLYDRFRRHYVVDYFSINYGRLKKVIFNLGDMMIFAGSLLILIHELWESIRDGR